MEIMVCQACGHEAPDQGISPDDCPSCGQEDTLLFFSQPSDDTH